MVAGRQSGSIGALVYPPAFVEQNCAGQTGSELPEVISSTVPRQRGGRRATPLVLSKMAAPADVFTPASCSDVEVLARDKFLICGRDQFLARVLEMSLSFNQKQGAHICCCMCCAHASSGIVRLVI